MSDTVKKPAPNPLFKLGEAAPDASLLDEKGQTVRLSELWSKRPVLLALIRHYG